MNVKLLKSNKYISDGDINKVVIPSNKIKILSENIEKEIKVY